MLEYYAGIWWCYYGGFADYISASEKNVFKIPDNVQWDVAASLATTTKTPYHALREASP
jgi:D-arabinose 1-dehydrogenase-like Zn-dependent alcohol dehydrogenase